MLNSDHGCSKAGEGAVEKKKPDRRPSCGEETTLQSEELSLSKKVVVRMLTIAWMQLKISSPEHRTLKRTWPDWTGAPATDGNSGHSVH